MAEFPPKSQRDQILALVAFLGIAAIIGFYMLVWSEKKTTLDELQARVDTLSARNDTAKKEMARGTLEELQAETERLRSNLQVMRNLVPTGNEVPALIDQVSSAARRAGLDLTDVQPEPVIAGDAFDAHRYRMALQGDYHSIGEFLSNVGGLTRIITPMNLTLAPAEGRSPSRRPREGEQLLEATFMIQTYVAKTGQPAGGAQ